MPVVFEVPFHDVTDTTQSTVLRSSTGTSIIVIHDTLHFFKSCHVRDERQHQSPINRGQKLAYVLTSRRPNSAALQLKLPSGIVASLPSTLYTLPWARLIYYLIQSCLTI